MPGSDGVVKATLSGGSFYEVTVRLTISARVSRTVLTDGRDAAFRLVQRRLDSIACSEDSRKELCHAAERCINLQSCIEEIRLLSGDHAPDLIQEEGTE